MCVFLVFLGLQRSSPYKLYPDLGVEVVASKQRVVSWSPGDHPSALAKDVAPGMLASRRLPQKISDVKTDHVFSFRRNLENALYSSFQNHDWYHRISSYTCVYILYIYIYV